MFLYYLNTNEGEAFLELANIAIMADGVVKDCEIAVIENYKKELSMQDYQIKNLSYESILNVFKDSSKQVKRSIIIELTAILYSDKEIDESEITWIEKLSKDLNIEEKEFQRLLRWAKDLADFVEVGLMYINCQ
jgi:uncharacterized tellurite resistance protein B-like protein